MADKKHEGGKSPTKFMERKTERSEEQIRKDQAGAEFIEDDLDALERQETFDEEEARSPHVGYSRQDLEEAHRMREETP